MTYNKEIDEEANKKGKAVGIVGVLPAVKAKVQASWKDKWSGVVVLVCQFEISFSVGV